jgi:hypothetical protein
VSGYDITDELRINWDENQTPAVPYFCASAGWDTATVHAAVRLRMQALRHKADDIERWLDAHKAIPETERRDSIHGGPAKKKTGKPG